MKPRRIVDLCCAFIWLFAAGSVFAQSDPPSPSYGAAGAEFVKANQEYAAGHFKEAISGYEAIARSGNSSANLFYNLGNAYFRTADLGRAILNYERALAVDRHHPEAEANLRIARDRARALELTPSASERALRFGTENQFTIAATIAFWIAAFMLARVAFARRRSGAAVTLSILCLLIFAGAAFASYQLENGSNGRDLAVVVDGEVEARLATADNAHSVLTLPAGSEVKMLSTRGDWVYAALPNNLRGWLPAKNVERVRL